jgi:hypothetical protein
MANCPFVPVMEFIVIAAAVIMCSNTLIAAKCMELNKKINKIKIKTISDTEWFLVVCFSL